ncbi:MAG: amino acid ABC transporter permease [Oculatellaceae cyanobacterium bins.114]|nr:amino acid ABC transporter permease [Oculatellaceae cyanobacterium bins.114]
MDWVLMLKSIPLLVNGLGWTIVISGLGMMLAMIMGIGLVIMRRSPIPLFRFLSQCYTEIILGVPILVLLFVIFFVLPNFGIVIDPLPAGLLTLMLHYSPYIAEVIRGALDAVPKGQIEAGRAIGMARHEIVQRIVLPQAIGVMLPPLTGQFIGLIKDSAILSVISVAELTFVAKQVISRTYAPFEIYILIAIGYWVLTFVLELALRKLETRFTAYRYG